MYVYVNVRTCRLCWVPVQIFVSFCFLHKAVHPPVYIIQLYVVSLKHYTRVLYLCNLVMVMTPAVATARLTISDVTAIAIVTVSAKNSC